MIGHIAVVALAAATLHTHGFHTPSGNISCYQFSQTSGLRCDESRATYPPPKKPKSCEFDYGSSFFVRFDSKHGKLACVSDANPRGPVLGYGRHWSRGGVGCLSQRVGVTCRNGKGHGFFVSRQRYRTF